MQWAKKYNVIICDDVRQEIGNKLSIMGIYSDRIIFNELPNLLPKLSVAIFLEGLKKKISEIEIKIKNPKMEPLEIKVPPVPDQKLGENVNIAFFFMPYKVEAPGDAKIEIYFEEGKRPSIIHKFKLESRGSKKV